MKCFYKLTIVLIVASVLLQPVVLYASGFISAGTGFSVVGSDSDDESMHGAIPITLGCQFTKGYRDSFLLGINASYTHITGDYEPQNIMIATAGLMYIVPFTVYRSNVTETSLRNNNCLGILLLPFTVTRDTMTNIMQLVIPQSPVFYLGPAILREKKDSIYNGFSAGIGVTSGVYDVMLRYTQSLRYEGAIKRDIYTAGIEITFNIPLQNRFIRNEKLID